MIAKNYGTVGKPTQGLWENYGDSLAMQPMISLHRLMEPHSKWTTRKMVGKESASTMKQMVTLTTARFVLWVATTSTYNIIERQKNIPICLLQ